MTKCVSVYGFGSAFFKKECARDIDILIVHRGADQLSCALAIYCKRSLRRSLAQVHVTMLSHTEEEHFHFIETAKAVFLGIIRADHIDCDLEVIKSVLPTLSNQN